KGLYDQAVQAHDQAVDQAVSGSPGRHTERSQRLGELRAPARVDPHVLTAQRDISYCGCIEPEPYPQLLRPLPIQGQELDEGCRRVRGVVGETCTGPLVMRLPDALQGGTDQCALRGE